MKDIFVFCPGERLDQWLAEELNEPLKKIKKSIRSGRIMVNTRFQRVGYVLKSGDHIEIRTSLIKRLSVDGRSVRIKHLDDEIIVVNKPPGMMIHPTKSSSNGTLSGLFAPLMMRDVGSEERLGVVHRLERWTSGLIVLARTPDAFSDIQNQFRQRLVQREYVAVVHGIPEQEEGYLEDRIGVHPSKKRRMSILATGKEAKMSYKILSTSTKQHPVSLLRCRIETGLFHQIRVQLANAGHPILGDFSYGEDRSAFFRSLGIEHPLLHAQTLGFKHPNGEVVQFRSSPHPSFQSIQDHFLLID
ncbi:MAG: RluA family pseudouridine synthase [Myxococcota bacterium]|nr:RluA family pseudouridine synthase [Myxococcota bacterium]